MARSSALAVAFAACALAVSLTDPRPAGAEYCRPAMPDHAADARGHTFQAIVERMRTEGGNPGLTLVTLAVEHVYANGNSDALRPGAAIDLYSNSCDGFALVGLQVGDRIVMSTGAMEERAGPSTWNSAVWHVDGSHLRLAVLRGAFDRVWFTDDRRIEQAVSLAQALALVAPGALPMPETALESPPMDPAAWLLALIGLGGTLVAAVAIGGSRLGGATRFVRLR